MLTILSKETFFRRLAGFWIGLYIKLKGNIDMQSFKSTEKYFFYKLQIYGVFRETPFYGKKTLYYKGILKVHVFNTYDGTLSL